MQTNKKKKYQITSSKYDFVFEWFGVITIFLIWFIFSVSVKNDYLVPSFESTFNELFYLLGRSSTYEAFGLTFYRTLVSLLISLVLGIGLGLLSGLFLKTHRFLKPFVNLMRFIPIPCFIFLIFGNVTNYELGSILITFIVIFPLIYEAIVGGIININDDIKMSLKLDGYYNLRSIFHVILPSTFSQLNVAIINSIGIGIKASIMSEIILGSSRIWGIGRLIFLASYNANFPMLFALIIIIVIVFLITDAISNIFKKKLEEVDD